MLKKRVIAILPLINGIVVQSIGFNKYLPVGKPEIAVEFLNQWGIDEIIVLDIKARSENKTPCLKRLNRIAKKCFVPLTYGGGICRIEEVEQLMSNGADKIAVNNALFSNPTLITQVAKFYGDQSVVVSLDVKLFNGVHHVFNHVTKEVAPIPLNAAIQRATDCGAGEILITAVDRDGYYVGYDIQLMRSICNQTRLPVLASGGAKNAFHLCELFLNSPVSAACVGNYFHFFEHSVNITKKVLNEQIGEIRMDNFTNYQNVSVEKNGRLKKIDDSILDGLLYEKFYREEI